VFFIQTIILSDSHILSKLSSFLLPKNRFLQAATGQAN